MSRINHEKLNKLDKVGLSRSDTRVFAPWGIKKVDKRRRFCAKFGGICQECKTSYKKGDMVIYNFTQKKMYHEKCL